MYPIRREGRLVGGIGLVYRDRIRRGTEIGYWIGESFQGQGIVTRGARALVGYLFSRTNLHRIEIQAREQKRRSRAVAERLGFVFDGLRRDAQWVHGRFVNVAVYSLLKPDWTDGPSTTTTRKDAV